MVKTTWVVELRLKTVDDNDDKVGGGRLIKGKH